MNLTLIVNEAEAFLEVFFLVAGNGSQNHEMSTTQNPYILSRISKWVRKAERRKRQIMWIPLEIVILNGKHTRRMNTSTSPYLYLKDFIFFLKYNLRLQRNVITKLVAISIG